MIKRPLTFALSAVVCLLVAIACQKTGSDALPPPPDTEIPDNKVIASFVGRVLDEKQLPVKNALVKAGQKTTTTDDRGIFRISSVTVSEQFAYIKVEKPGYFNGSRTIIANTTAANFVEIQLIEKKLTGSFNAANVADIVIDNSAAVKFSANSITTKNGADYNGNVNVYAAVIDPSADNFNRMMPGDLRGLRTDSSVTAMISYGMITVLLIADNGEELQLRQGKPAVFSIPVNRALQAAAPSEMPLWYFDETDGKWKEEGKAVKQGNNYVGEVPHFSTWNFDVPADFVRISLHIRGEKARSMPYTPVKIMDTRNNTHTVAYSDSTGRLQTWAPKNAPIAIEVISRCNKTLAKINAGPFNDDAVIDPVIVSTSDEVIVVSGIVVNCEGQRVKMGKVKLFLGGLYYSADVQNGDFTVMVNNCSETELQAELYAIDSETDQAGNPGEITMTGKRVNAGELRACGKELTEYAILKIGDRRFQLQTPRDKIDFRRNGDTTNIWFGLGYAYSTTQISVGMLDTVPHSFSIPAIVMSAADTFYSASGNIQYNLTKYGKVNDYIEMNFSGTVMNDTSGIFYPFVGEMRVKRPY